jgi:hypothetical protein
MTLSTFGPIVVRPLPKLVQVRVLTLAAVTLAASLIACAKPVAPRAPTRSYLLGFSATPPKLEIASVIETLNQWTPRADGALMQLTPPWRAMLADTSAAFVIRREQLDIVKYYRDHHLPVVVMIDVTDGLARDREHPDLVALGRSIREPAIQALYHEYVMAVDSILHPDYVGLAMETNLIRAAAPRDVYDAMRVMVNAAAAALQSAGSQSRRYVSVQVETAWGRLPNTGSYVGVADDLRDFPFVQALGLSSYPFLGGFAEPEDVPLDYYSRLVSSGSLPLLVVEGGWSSASVPNVTSSPEKQARYIARQMQIADHAHAAAIFQITYTDIDLTSWPVPAESILPLFAHLGLVDEHFQPKPALAEWDRAFARPHEP